MYDSISFIRPDGIEINLCNYYGDRTLYELIGRKGFEAPPLNYTDIIYAHGFSKTVAIRVNPRDVVLQMIVIGNSTLQRDTILHQLVKDLTISGSVGATGKLKIMRSNGKSVYLNCWYTGGIESIVEQYVKFHKFQLTFHAADPYFYDTIDTTYSAQDTEQKGLLLGTNTFLGLDVFLSGIKAGITKNVVNDGVITYPIITVTGPAKNIWFTNEATGKTIKMKPAFELKANENLVIDTREGQRSVTLIVGGESTDVIGSLSVESSLIWELVPGNNNIIVHISDVTPATLTEFSFTKKYLSA